MAHRFLTLLGRRAFTILSAVSLLLCLATLALWVRSYWRYDEFGRYEVQHQTLRRWAIRSVLGEISLRESRSGQYQPQPGREPDRGWSYASDTSNRAWTLRAFKDLTGNPASGWVLGFGFVRDDPSGGRMVAIPYWFVVLLLAILPALYLRAAIKSRKGHRGEHRMHGYERK